MTMILQFPGDKRRFMAGMYWRHEDRYPNHKALLNGARGRDFWVAVRRTRMRSIQSGFCAPVMDPRKTNRPLPGKVYSLAGALAEVMEEPWLGIFDLGNGLYWYIAVRENYEILPDGDVIGDFDTVDKARRGHAAYGDWRHLEDGGIDRLAELARKARKPPLIRDVRRKPWVPYAMTGGAAGVAVGAVLTGVYFYNQHEEHIEAQKRIALAQRIEIARAMDAKKAAANVPWRTTSLPATFLTGCLEAVSALPFSDQGWVLSQITCVSKGPTWRAMADWTLGPGATTLHRPQGTVGVNGGTVIGDLVGTGPLPTARNSGIAGEPQAEAQLYGIAQLLGAKLRISAAQTAAPHSMPGQKADVRRPVSHHPWQTLDIAMQGSLPVITESADLLNTVPGLRISAMRIPVLTAGKQSNMGMSIIKIVGKLYVQ